MNNDFTSYRYCILLTLIREKWLYIFSPLSRRNLFFSAVMNPCRRLIEGVPVAGIVPTLVWHCTRSHDTVARAHAIFVGKSCSIGRSVVGKSRIYRPSRKPVVQTMPTGGPIGLATDLDVVSRRFQDVVNLLTVIVWESLKVVPRTIYVHARVGLDMRDVVGIPPRPNTGTRCGADRCRHVMRIELNGISGIRDGIHGSCRALVVGRCEQPSNIRQMDSFK